MNEDYKKGMRFLLQKCKESGIDVRRVEWVPIYSRYLSELNCCYRFWYNVYKQNGLDRIEKCVTLFDISFSAEHVLFYWDETEEGVYYWYDKLLMGWGYEFNCQKKLTTFCD